MPWLSILAGEYPACRGEGGEAWLGKKDTGYLYKAIMVARCPLFLQKAIPLLYTTGKETILAERIENMEYRALGRTGWKISAIGFGAWGIGGNDWGSTDDKTSLAALNQAIDLGVNFIDTADVYGDGHSERLIAEVRKARSEEIIVATKAGRRLNPHIAAGYNRQNLTSFVERSLQNLQVEALDLLQLHSPPHEVYDMPESSAYSTTWCSRAKSVFMASV
jgi:Aldo/keto reductase family